MSDVSETTSHDRGPTSHASETTSHGCGTTSHASETTSHASGAVFSQRRGVSRVSEAVVSLCGADLSRSKADLVRCKSVPTVREAVFAVSEPIPVGSRRVRVACEGDLSVNEAVRQRRGAPR